MVGWRSPRAVTCACAESPVASVRPSTVSASPCRTTSSSLCCSCSGPLLDILLTGELIDADHARTVGLVNRVWPDAAVVEQGYGLVARIAAGAPLVNRWHKKFVRRLLERRPVTEEEREEAHEAFETADYSEGRAAFLEKRDPTFDGR